MPGASQVLNVSLHACQALQTPPGLHSLTKATASCWLPRPLPRRRLILATEVAIAISGLNDFREVRLPSGLHGSLCTLRIPCSALLALPPFRLRRIRNTRYWRLVRPYQAGSLTPQETPSFAWRATDSHQGRPSVISGRSTKATSLPSPRTVDTASASPEWHCWAAVGACTRIRRASVLEPQRGSIPKPRVSEAPPWVRDAFLANP